MKQQGFGMIVYLIAGIAIIAMLAGIAYKIRESGKNVVRLEWEQAKIVQRDKEAKQAALAATTLEDGNAKSRIIYRTITKEVDRIVNRDVYRSVCFDDDGLRVARAAIRGEVAAPPKSDKPLPPTTGPDRRDVWLDLKMDRAGL